MFDLIYSLKCHFVFLLLKIRGHETTSLIFQNLLLMLILSPSNRILKPSYCNKFCKYLFEESVNLYYFILEMVSQMR